MTIELSIPVIDATIIQNENTLTASAEGLTYQWYDCENGNEPLPGETEQAFAVAASGSYAVEITNGACSLFSDCVEVIVSSVANIEDADMRIYPNPTEDILQVQSTEYPMTAIAVYNLQGQLLRSKTVAGKNASLSMMDLLAGSYLVEVGTEQGVKYFTVVRL